ncbi:hypothetical protein OC846_000481 [Tilletia horrida]|uniref:Uncharacterized protein n=1 Tax=Tilletia horrida TaxID=155126 RepID=A0AAN6JTW8_9BASI|nr:hypothetical protein OC845_001117 [Tilletia horrida]KAK0557493.1 hypothetical protein OC846_000481 [Tilletia horrida]KAK0567890.1 hypothetical protein OC861_002450 [Tilletia horrida]
MAPSKDKKPVLDSIPQRESTPSTYFNDPDAGAIRAKYEALDWPQRWQHIARLHERKAKIQAELHILREVPAHKDEVGTPLQMRNSVAYRESARLQHDGTNSRRWFGCYLKAVFELEPEFFRSDSDKKDFALSHFSPFEYEAYEARNKRTGADDNWESVRSYLCL